MQCLQRLIKREVNGNESLLRKWDISQFVHYEQVVPGVLAQSPGKGFLSPAFQEFVDEIAGRGEPNPKVLPAGFYSKGRGEVGFPAPAFAQENVLPCPVLCPHCVVQ